MSYAKLYTKIKELLNQNSILAHKNAELEKENYKLRQTLKDVKNFMKRESNEDKKQNNIKVQKDTRNVSHAIQTQADGLNGLNI